MASIAEELAKLISTVFSEIGSTQTVLGSPGKIGDAFADFIAALISEVKKNGLRWVRGYAWPLFRQFWAIIVYCLGILALLLATVAYVVFWFQSGWKGELVIWSFCTSILISCLPLISRMLFQKWLPSMVALAAELGIFAVAVGAFAVFALKLPLHHAWALYTASLIALLAGGGRWVEIVHKQTGHNLLEEWKQPQTPNAAGGPNHSDIGSQLIALRRYFDSGLLIYAAFPLGVPIGLLFGTRYGVTPAQVASTSLCCVFGLACMFLAYFLWISCRLMAKPTLNLLPPATLENGSDAARDWACVMTEYRKMFLVDVIENTTLLITFFLLTWLLQGNHSFPSIGPKFIGAIVVTSIILNQIPYLLGQWHVQRALVRPYQGWTRIIQTKEATENLPLVPKFEWIAALIGEASAGGLAIEMMKKISELTCG